MKGSLMHVVGPGARGVEARGELGGQHRVCNKAWGFGF